MVGIALSAEEVRSAPPEIRTWLARQAAGLFGTGAAEASHPVRNRWPPVPSRRRAPAEASAILSQIQGMLPVVSVFFELGREAAGFAGRGVRVFNLPDIQRHARLRAPEQVAQCLSMINQVLGATHNDPSASLCALDPQGHCFVVKTTCHAILALWHEIVASRALEPVETMPKTVAAACRRPLIAGGYRNALHGRCWLTWVIARKDDGWLGYSQPSDRSTALRQPPFRTARRSAGMEGFQVWATAQLARRSSRPFQYPTASPAA
jgi:hypothetical protein